MLRYKAQKAQTFRHSSGAEFSFVMSASRREEYRTIQAAKVPSYAVQKDPITKLPTMAFHLLPESLQAQMNLDEVYLPAYCLQSANGVHDESGSCVDVTDMDIESRADLLLFACESDAEFRPWLRNLLQEPEKKAAQMDSGKQLVGAEDLRGMPPPPEST